MFILPNNKHIDYETLIDFMLDADKKKIYWLDSETSECMLEEKFIKKLGRTDFEQKINNSLFQIPKVSDFNRLQWMASYVSEMVEFEDKDFAQKLNDIILRENPQANFINKLQEAEKDGWIYGWNSWEGDNAFEEMKIWFGTLPFEIKEEMDFFCDCPICQAMKDGRTSEEELKDAFREANFKNVIKDIYNNNDD